MAWKVGGYSDTKSCGTGARSDDLAWRSAADRIAALGYDGGDLKEAINKAINTIHAIEFTTQDEGLYFPGDVMKCATQRYDSIANKINGIPIGFWLLDERLGGIIPGELVIIGASTFVGKTTIARQIARHIGKEKWGLYVSLEMENDELTDKDIVTYTDPDITTLRIRQGMLEDADDTLSRIMVHVDDLGRQKIINDTGSRKVSDIRKTIDYIYNKRMIKIDFVIVDYMQLLRGVGENRYAQVTDISRELKLLAKDYYIPVIAISQFTREPSREERRPTMSDLRDSGAIEQDASIILLLHRLKDNEICEVHAVKNRGSGKTGVQFLKWKKEREIYESITKVQVENLGYDLSWWEEN